MEKVTQVEATCPRTDCGGWQGTVTYTQRGEFDGEWPLPVREGCVALDAWLASDGAVALAPCALSDDGGEG